MVAMEVEVEEEVVAVVAVEEVVAVWESL